MNKIFAFVLIGFLLASCEQGQLSEITKTPIPTSTHTLPPSNTPTLTPTNTFTPIPTNTSTLTPTYTPSPTQIGGGSGKLIFELFDDDFANIFPDLDGARHVFTANIDGTNLTPVSIGLSGYNYLTDISPDGMNALIVSSSSEPVSENDHILYLLNLNVANSVPMELAKLDEPDNFNRGHVAKWIDNNRLIYIGIGESGFGIYIINGDGTNQMKVYKPEVLDEELTPYRTLFVNESRVYWTAAVSLSGNSSEEHVWWSSIDGSEYGKLEYGGQQIIKTHFWDSLAISPDGSKIAWSTFDNNTFEGMLYIAELVDMNNPYEFKLFSNTIDMAWMPEGSSIIVYDSGYYWQASDPSGYFGFYELSVSPDMPVTDFSDLFVDIAPPLGDNHFCANPVKDISPDGKQILSLPASDGSAMLLELDSMTISEVLPGISFGNDCLFYKILWVP